MSDMTDAIAAYRVRIAHANADMRGADSGLILAEVARDYGVPLEALDDATLRDQFSTPN